MGIKDIKGIGQVIELNPSETRLKKQVVEVGVELRGKRYSEYVGPAAVKDISVGSELEVCVEIVPSEFADFPGDNPEEDEVVTCTDRVKYFKIHGRYYVYIRQ